MLKEYRWPEGLKRTKQREAVLDVLIDTDKPLTAGDIYEILLTGSEKNRMSPSTIYRVLEAFAEKDMVEETTIPGDDSRYYKLKRDGYSHYATCISCHRQIPIKFCPVEEAEDEMLEGLPEFKVTAHRIDLYGYCKDCLEKEEEKKNED